MGKSERKIIRSGTLIKWFEMYPEMFVKNAGLGIVMNHEKRSGAGLFDDYVIYNVYRFLPHLDFMYFSANELEIPEKNNG
ncbi:MAG: hypothetical protein CBB97_00445 [Candidatus Endolissoclinum sp. TMED37]|nr:MAG: hypothetical protein CBB97_00445 [Candidatus Endolissoclinum sp. TMED37]|tara:strand:- start:65 stop:304 length:240 start_codon:yes stop_codon:yes gene_type:complete